MATAGGKNEANGHSTKASTASATATAQTEHHGLARLAICASGICISYLYYGLLQERLFTGEQRLGASFVLVTQCVTNTLVALAWRQVQQKLRLTSNTDTRQEDSQQTKGLHHTLLIFTAGCYVGAMACSNEAIQYVSYPVAVLAKSCKLIPTMLVGQTVEGRLYSTQEWLAAVLISAGIVIFHFSRLENANILQDNDNNDSDDVTYGMSLLCISLAMDGILSSCQNFIKRPVVHDATGTAVHRPPSAVETMLFINLYALFFLVPACLYTGQWQTGWASLFLHTDLQLKVGILNATVAVGQIFIFLTIT